VLERFVARLRDRVESRLWRRLGGNVNESQQVQLAALVSQDNLSVQTSFESSNVLKMQLRSQWSNPGCIDATAALFGARGLRP
jgi:hypothetical protein